MREGLTLTKKEQQRARVLTELVAGKLGLFEAAALLGLGERQVRRLKSAYLRQGPAGLVHGNRGKAPPHRISDGLRQEVVALACGKYAGFNACHLTEMLQEEGIELSRASVQRILVESGIRTPRRRRPRHRSRRERYPREGMLLQIDGSHHDWLQGRGPRLVLLGAIDDATGKIAAARFHSTEDGTGYFLLMRQLFASHGLPLALYSDKHSIFRPTATETIAEQLGGQRALTQFGRAMAEVAVNVITANSPQAKGRVERLWGTLQSRLVSEMRLARVCSLDEANAFLPGFVVRFNHRFAIPAAEPGTAYRPVARGLDLEQVLCFKHYRKVARDNTVSFFPEPGKGVWLQLLPTTSNRGYSGKLAELRQSLDGAYSVLVDGRTVPSRPLTLRQRLATPKPQPKPVRQHGPAPAAKPSTPTSIPAPDHPWRTPAVTKSLST